MKHTDIFERASDWNARGDALRLRPAEWMLLEAIDGWRSMGDLLRGSDLDLPTASAMVGKLEKLDLIRRAEYTWDEYCRRARGQQVTAPAPAPAPALPVSAVPVTQSIFGAPAMEPTAPAPAPAPAAPLPPAALEPPPSQVRFRLGARPLPVAIVEPEPAAPAPEPPVVEATAHAPQVEAEMPVTFAPPPVRIAPTVPLVPPPAVPASLLAPVVLPPPVAPAPPAAPALIPTNGPLALRAVLDFVISRAGGGTKGQLAVYRTFLKVPMHLLRESGIKSLNVSTSDIVIADPDLKDSILRAVESVVGEPFPGPGERVAA